MNSNTVLGEVSRKMDWTVFALQELAIYLEGRYIPQYLHYNMTGWVIETYTSC